MAKEDDILRDAMIGTEQEIFAKAFGKEDLTLDETGDRSLEAMGDGLEGQVEPEDEDDVPDEADEGGEPDKADEPKAETVEAKVEAKAKAATEAKDEPQGRVPAGRLREEAEARRAAEAAVAATRAELDAFRKAAADERAALLATFQKAIPQPVKQAEPEAPKTPDLFEDPVAFAEHINKQVQSRFDAMTKEMRDREINASLSQAQAKHGQVYEEAFGALKSLDFKNPDNVALVKRMEASPNPGETVVAWHKRNQALREVGDDIVSYKARIAEETRKSLTTDPEFRKELLASLRGEAETGDQGRPRTVTRLPKSLSQTSGNGGRMNDLDVDRSDQAVFARAFST